MQISHAGRMTPATSFSDMEATIHESLAPINRAIAIESPAIVSVRLSQNVLLDAATTDDALRDVLAAHNLVFSGISAVGISGGAKDRVHHPDWRTEERLEFVYGASNLAAKLADPDREISITTNALSHRSWLDTTMPGNWAALTLNVVRAVQHLVGIRDKTGITMHLDLEVEPGSVLRDTADVVAFYHTWLLGRGAAMLSDRMQVADGTAAEAILRHVRIALDTAHAAVVRDYAASTLDAFAGLGIRIGRLQVSSALEVDVPDGGSDQAELAEQLRLLQSETLLQQVVATRDGEIVVRYDDLPDAIAALPSAAGETWRIHTHAPVLADRYGRYRSTRADSASWLREIAERGIDVGMIELRSANWDVVPHDDRAPLETMILREVAWVRDIIG